MLEIIAIALAGILLMLVLRNRLYAIFFVILLMTEFYYIEIGGGIARPYHFIAVAVVLSLARYIPLLFSSRVFVALLIFVGINIFAILMSDAPDRAMASFLSFCANLAIAMGTALILLSGKVELSSFKRIILTVSMISIVFGLVQIAAYRLAGINLALSLTQVGQIEAGFGPAFRTEANSFGKYMVFPVLLFLPEYLEHKQIKHISWIYLLFLVGILMSFTRSAIYGMGIASVFILAWYAKQKKLFLLTTKSMKIAVFSGISVALILSGVFTVGEYTIHKINNLFNQQEILEGASSSYRMEMMRLIIDDALTNTKKLIIGNGWGQTRYYIRNIEKQVGGADVLNALGFAGLLGVTAYLAYTFLSFTAASKSARLHQDVEKAHFAEGIMFAVAGIFCTAQLAGYLIAPEYWMLIGITMYLSIRDRGSEGDMEEPHQKTNTQRY